MRYRPQLIALLWCSLSLAGAPLFHGIEWWKNDFPCKREIGLAADAVSSSLPITSMRVIPGPSESIPMQLAVTLNGQIAVPLARIVRFSTGSEFKLASVESRGERIETIRIEDIVAEVLLDRAVKAGIKAASANRPLDNPNLWPIDVRFAVVDVPRLRVTSVNVDCSALPAPYLAVATVTLNDAFIIHNVRLRNGDRRPRVVEFPTFSHHQWQVPFIDVFDRSLVHDIKEAVSLAYDSNCVPILN